MPYLRRGVTLKEYNFFRVNHTSDYFFTFTSETDKKIIEQEVLPLGIPILPLGEGSNILFVHDFQGCIIHICNQGIEVKKENDKHVWIEVQSGENWDAFVQFCVNHSYFGIENLSLIPGTVGASPIQNIGAYGVEVKDFFVCCQFYDFNKRHTISLSNEECTFSYRNSIFKKELKNKGLITSVTFKLNKFFEPNISYGNIKDELNKKKIIDDFSAHQLRNIIIQIRQNKLPDPETYPNTGSFFKNPIVTKQQMADIQKVYHDVPYYMIGEDQFKIPAAAILEKMGYKGLKKNNVSTWKNQPLVIVSNGLASGSEIFDFSEEIINQTKHRFGITLQREVNAIK